MAKKPGTNPKNEFVFFDVTYEDGTQRSNRRVPAELFTGVGILDRPVETHPIPLGHDAFPQ